MANREMANFITFNTGVITCEHNGHIYHFIQRDVHRLSDREIRQAVGIRMLPENWKDFKEFPRNWSLNIEDPSIQGKVTVTFSKTRLSKMNGTYVGRT